MSAGVGSTELREYVIDGNTFDDLQGFFHKASEILGTAPYGRSFDAFNDVLRGGFGTPEEGFVVRWTNSSRSAELLGFDETLRWLEAKLQSCHPSNRESVRREIEAARNRAGETVFDILIEIFQTHGPGGTEAEDNVHLLLQ